MNLNMSSISWPVPVTTVAGTHYTGSDIQAVLYDVVEKKHVLVVEVESLASSSKKI